MIFERTAQLAGTVVDRYGEGPIDERGAGYSQSGTIVIAGKDYGMPDAKRRAIVDCTKYATKAQGGEGAAAAPATTQPPPLDLDENTAKVHDRSEVADADFGTVELVKVQDPRPPKGPFLPASGSRFIGVTFKLTGKARLSYRGFSLRRGAVAADVVLVGAAPIPARSPRACARAAAPPQARRGRSAGPARRAARRRPGEILLAGRTAGGPSAGATRRVPSRTGLSPCCGTRPTRSQAHEV